MSDFTPTVSSGQALSPISSPGLQEMIPSSDSFMTPPNSKTVGSSGISSGGSPSSERSEGRPHASPCTPRSNPERIVDCKRKLMTIKPRVFTDSQVGFYPWGLSKMEENAMSDEEYENGVANIADDLLKRSPALVMGMHIEGDGYTSAEGQVFVIDTEKGPVFSTVLHNFCGETNSSGKQGTCVGASLHFPNREGVVAFPLFNDKSRQNLLNWNADALPAGFVVPFLDWKYGRELEFIPVDPESGAGAIFLEEIREQRVTAYKAVKPTFEIEKGMTIGIVARSSVGMMANTLKKELGIQEEEQETSVGKEVAKNLGEGDVFITVGHITKIGTEHIEYSANTVPGFSGGAVVLLDSESEYHMHVLAAHAGFSETHGENFGFLVAKKVEQYEAPSFLEFLTGVFAFFFQSK